MKIATKQSPQSEVVQVRPVDVSEAEQAFATLMLAFAADPPNRWLYPVEDEYLSQFPTLSPRSEVAHSIEGQLSCPTISLALPCGLLPIRAPMMRH